MVGEQKMRKFIEEMVKVYGDKVKTVTIDMTGGGRPYENWSKEEREQAIRELVTPKFSRAGYGIDGEKLPKEHPYHGLNDNGKVHAACCAYVTTLIRFQEASRVHSDNSRRFVQARVA